MSPQYEYQCETCQAVHIRSRPIDERREPAGCLVCGGRCELYPSLTASRPDMTVMEA